MKPPVQPQILLECPECTRKSAFPVATLVPGGKLACPRCGAELSVAHDRDTPDGPPIWRLESIEAEEELTGA